MKIHTMCKKKARHEYIENIGVGLTLDTFTYGGAGYVKSWQLSLSNETHYRGKTIEELIAQLNQLKDIYDLQYLNEYHTDMLLIYTDDLKLLYCFLRNYDKDAQMFKDYNFVFKKVFEFRDISHWYDKPKHDAYDIACKVQHLFDDIFIPEKRFYITPTKSVLTKIKKHCDSDIAKKLYPMTYYEYKRLLRSYFGGICVANVKNTELTEENDFPIAEHDRKSAYIFDLLIEKHICEPLKSTDKYNYQFFLDNEDKYFAIMKIKIRKIYGISYYLTYIRDANGKRLDENTEVLILTNIDFNLLIKGCKTLEYDVLSLDVARKDYLPEYMRNVIEEEYIKKEAVGTLIQKKKVNSIYGATVKKFNEEDFKSQRDNAYLAPHWGIETASYARRNLIKLALQLDNWLYTDTDSIYCEDNEKNAIIIDEYNKEVERKVKAYCDKFGSDFEKLKDLGKFMFKKSIIKMRINNKKQYMYTDSNGQFTLKASGIPEGMYGEEAYDMPKLKAGTRKNIAFNPEKTSCTINGTTYESNGSGYIKDINDFEFIGLSYIEDYMTRRKL